MNTIPTNLARVPNMLASQIMLSSIGGTNRQLLNTQIQLATGHAINRPSDNAVGASTVSVLDDILERREQRMRNLNHASSVLNTTDAALSDASDLLLEAKSIGLGQIGAGSDAQTRANQAQVIDSMLNEMVRIGNRQYQNIHLFAGGRTALPPFADLLAGIHYMGTGGGLVTDIGLPSSIPITTSGEQAFGALSARVRGDHDLDPTLTATTRLADMNGALGRGITLGSINIDVGGTDIEVDLSSAHTIGDVAQLLQDAIQTIDAGTTVAIDGATDNRLAISGNSVAITISDLSTTPATAADLGLAATFNAGGGTGGDLDPRLTMLTPVSALGGVTLPLGTIRLSNGGQTRDLDLSSAQTVQDLANLVEGLHLGIRVQIDAEGLGGRLNFVNELSGNPARGMSIAEVGGGTTASELGIRSLTADTLLSEFNGGLGVQIKTGSVDPVSGLPDPARDVDFTITVKDGRSFDVDLEDVTTVQDVLDQINAAATAAGITPAEFAATLASDGNGIMLTDNTVGTTTVIQPKNGSFAAGDLGLMSSNGSFSGATFTGEDRATIAVESVFSHLAALRDALLANDERGISLATGALDGDIERVASSRAGVGVRSQRVQNALEREEDLKVQDTSLKSQIQDLDYAQAATRFTTLQQQLQAALTVTARTNSLSLLDFLR